ncbi:MAG: hypothetical protein NZ920_01530 [Aigarchaeota archaeon]|nr:hypothetical protein [Aigarchaeota archaeon]MDW8093123.1 hypothetical protein [Nitrososphaerota archaeon]
MSSQDVDKTILRFLDRLFNGHIQDSEKMLERLSKRIESDEDVQLYRALYGIYYSYTTEDRDSLIYKLYRDGRLSDDRKKYRESLERLLNEPDGSKNEFIRVWLRVIDLLEKAPLPHKFRAEEGQQSREGVEEQ